MHAKKKIIFDLKRSRFSPERSFSHQTAHLMDRATLLHPELSFEQCTSNSSTLTFNDAKLNNLLLAYSYKVTAKRPQLTAPAPAKPRAFAPLKSKEEVKQARENAIPKNTQDDTQYCVGMWNE